MLPPYLADQFENQWSPVVAFAFSFVSVLIYGNKSDWGDGAVLVSVLTMVVGMVLLGAIMQRVQHERVRFLIWSSLIFMGVLLMWIMVGFIWKEHVWVSESKGALVLTAYCSYGMWVLMGQSKSAFEQFDARERVFWAFAAVVFLFPITDASSYSNPGNLMLTHFGAFSVIYWLRVLYVSRFEHNNSAWLIRQNTLGTIWLLDVPSIPAIVVYSIVFSWSMYKLGTAEGRRIELTPDDTQSKVPSLKPVPEPKLPNASAAAVPPNPRRVSFARKPNWDLGRPKVKVEAQPERPPSPTPDFV